MINRAKIPGVLLSYADSLEDDGRAERQNT